MTADSLPLRLLLVTLAGSVWYRRLIAQKWTWECRRQGRPGLMKEIATLIVRMATENPAWGYSRIQGALKNLDHRVARSTVAKVLKDNGIPPAAVVRAVGDPLHAPRRARNDPGEVHRRPAISVSRRDLIRLSRRNL